MPREHEYVRPPSVAGLFYPADRNDLESTCLRMLDEAKEDLKISLEEKPFGIISPHAGYQYSGFTAAHGYSFLRKGEFERVVVVAPSHREYFDGVSVFSGKSYSTPLGEVEVDSDLRESFLETAGDWVIESRAGHKSEHALEVQLPFLQVTLGSFKLLPIVMGDQKRKFCDLLGRVLSEISAKRNVLIVASSDLSHYYDYETANQLDSVCMDDVARLDPDKLTEDLESRRCEACGGGPISALLYAARSHEGMKSSLLHHCNSGDTTGDKSGVVGYLSAILS